MAPEPEAEVGPREEMEGFSIQAVPGRQSVLCGVRAPVNVLVTIRTPAADEAALAARRPPLRVVCVLDRSGSMGGQKITYAKRAAMKLVKHFEAGRDELHFVTYSTEASVVFQNGDLSEGGKSALRDQIDAVRTGGGTNLFAGMESAVSLLSGTDVPSVSGKCNKEDGALRRVFLFSDGLVNAGVTNQAEILESVRRWSSAGIETSTFGIGSDFDETLMRKIAEEGKGRYAYLATAADIPKLVSKSVHDLLDLYASDAVLDIRGWSHTTVSRIYGAGSDAVEADDDDMGNSTGAVPGLLCLGDLHYDNERQVLFELDVSPPGDSDLSSFVAAEWTLTLQRNGTSAQFSGKVELCPTRDRGLLEPEGTPVRTAFAIQRSADLDLLVARNLARGNRDKAREVKEQQLAVLQAALAAAQADAAAHDAEVLARVLERAQRVALQLNNLGDDGDSDVVRRHCVQEIGLNRAMSDGGWRSGCDSDDAGDVGRLADLEGLSPPNSPTSSPPDSPRLSRSRSSSPRSSRSRSSSPRPSRSGPSPAARPQRQSGFGGMVQGIVQSLRRRPSFRRGSRS